MFWSLLHKISAFGTNPALPTSINRQIVLCNRIAMLLIVQTMVFILANSILRFDVIKIITSLVSLFVYSLVLLLNKYNYHVISRLLACLVIPTINTIFQIIARTNYPNDIFVTQYFGDRVLVLGATLFPLLLLNPKREPYFFWFAYSYIASLLLFYDPIQTFFNIDIHRANIPQYLKGYSFINITFFLVMLGMTLAVVFLKNMNTAFESQIIRANATLEAQKEEILSQNAQLEERQQEITIQRDYIEEQHNQTKNSIKVAKTIQSAILPNKERLVTILQEHFVIYTPRDVVSGDFYWVGQVQTWNILVVADCTGHGVPGAFMTLIAHTLLDKIVNVWQITEPHIILQKLHEDVVITLNQDIDSNNMGMDALVVTWKSNNPQEIVLKFEGAKIDLYYILPEKKQVDTLRATRKSIGGEQNEQRIFQTQTVVLPALTQIYVGSDGLLDQNNVNRKRLGIKKLYQTLLQNSSLALHEQEKALKEMLMEYMQGTPQRDDILWIGFRL